MIITGGDLARMLAQGKATCLVKFFLNREEEHGCDAHLVVPGRRLRVRIGVTFRSSFQRGTSSPKVMEFRFHARSTFGHLPGRLWHHSGRHSTAKRPDGSRPAA